MTQATLSTAQKREISCRYFLLGKGYHRAIRCMDYNQKLFSGTRKDGITPEFDHHISQVHYVRTLPDLLFPEETICTIFFHDTPEDHDMSKEEVYGFLASEGPLEPRENDRIFARRVSEAAWRLTKKWRGTKRCMRELFDEMARCPIASIGKGCDRIHNINTMVGVFSEQKQRDYLQEVDEFFLPMLKQAERNFPEQEAAYQNIRTVLKNQVSLIRAFLDSKGVPGIASA